MKHLERDERDLSSNGETDPSAFGQFVSMVLLEHCRGPVSRSDLRP